MIKKGDLVQYRYLSNVFGLVLNIFNTDSKVNYMPTSDCAIVMWGNSDGIMFVDVNKLIKVC